MPQVIRAFWSADAWQERANCSVDRHNGSRFGASQEFLEFAVSHLDWVEVRGIFRQVPEGRSSLFDDLANAGIGMGPAIVNDDDVTSLKGWTQTLLQIGQKHLSVHGSFKRHWRRHFVVPHRSYESDCPPDSKRNATNHSHTPRSPPSETHHGCRDSSFIEKHQLGGVKQALLSNPASARSGHICSLSLGSLQAFF
jgi:hypothetical protein